MRYITNMLVLGFIVLLAGCASVRVNHDYDPQHDFNEYKTFKWGQADIENDALKQNPMLAKRINETVQNVLQEKGFVLLEDENADPDFVVVTHAGLKDRVQVQTTSYAGYGRYYRGWYDPWWGPYGGQTHVSHYEEGTLVIDIVDMKNKELAWRGLGTKTIGNRTGDKQLQVIDNVVRRIMSSFPPQ